MERMDLQAIQQALAEADLDGWLFYDFHHRDQMAYRVLGLDPNAMVSRRWFYYIPREGEPVKLAHRVEPHQLDSLPGRPGHYLAWTELHAKLKETVGGASRVSAAETPCLDRPRHR